MSLKFIRTIEDFTCEQCGYEVRGTGYTNHCPECLWCKHVDVFPGDRAETCGGLMEPVEIMIKKGKEAVVHKCTRCGIQRTTTCVAGDNTSVLFD